MNDTLRPISPETRARERTDVAIALLLVQAVLGLLALLGMAVLAALMPLISPADLLVAAGFLVPLLAAAGLARGWRWARRAAIGWQVFALLSFAINLLLAALPQVQMELTLSGILTGAALPIALIALLRAPRPAHAPIATSDRFSTTAATGTPAPAGARRPLGV